MIKIENVEVVGWEAALRGMRNPMNSWDRSDSKYAYSDSDDAFKNAEYIIEKVGKYLSEELGNKAPLIGKNDLNLMTRLAEGGSCHAKYRRMITVYMDVTAPLYWWKEADTYKVGTVANSCSTMHKIHSKEFSIKDFSCEHLVSGWMGKDNNDNEITLPGPIECMENTIIMLNRVRQSYLEALKEKSKMGLTAKEIWYQMIQLLPSSYNQKRTLMLNYEVLANIYKYRKNHKLDEWRVFCDWIKTLPYSEIITGEKTE